MGNGIDITLPIGMSASDIDVGTATHVSGRIYQIKFVDSPDVQSVIGGSSPEVVHLCKHANVNKWAAFKPHEVDGFGQYRTGMKIVSGYLVWDNPTGQAWRDLGHFAGYNHNAPAPGFDLANSSLSYTSHGVKDFVLWVKLPEFDIRELGVGVMYIEASTASGDAVYTQITDGDISSKVVFAEFEHDTNTNGSSATVNIRFIHDGLPPADYQSFKITEVESVDATLTFFVLDPVISLDYDSGTFAFSNTFTQVPTNIDYVSWDYSINSGSSWTTINGDTLPFAYALDPDEIGELFWWRATIYYNDGQESNLSETATQQT